MPGRHLTDRLRNTHNESYNASLFYDEDDARTAFAAVYFHLASTE